MTFQKKATAIGISLASLFVLITVFQNCAKQEQAADLGSTSQGGCRNSTNPTGVFASNNFLTTSNRPCIFTNEAMPPYYKLRAKLTGPALAGRTWPNGQNMDSFQLTNPTNSAGSAIGMGNNDQVLPAPSIGVGPGQLPPANNYVLSLYWIKCSTSDCSGATQVGPESTISPFMVSP